MCIAEHKRINVVRENDLMENEQEAGGEAFASGFHDVSSTQHFTDSDRGDVAFERLSTTARPCIGRTQTRFDFEIRRFVRPSQPRHLSRWQREWLRCPSSLERTQHDRY